MSLGLISSPLTLVEICELARKQELEEGDNYMGGASLAVIVAVPLEELINRDVAELGAWVRSQVLPVGWHHHLICDGADDEDEAGDYRAVGFEPGPAGSSSVLLEVLLSVEFKPPNEMIPDTTGRLRSWAFAIRAYAALKKPARAEARRLVAIVTAIETSQSEGEQALDQLYAVLRGASPAAGDSKKEE